MGRQALAKQARKIGHGFPMIPPQVNGATFRRGRDAWFSRVQFPMIPPQVNGATSHCAAGPVSPRKFPMIPPQVNGATNELGSQLRPEGDRVSNDSAPS